MKFGTPSKLLVSIEIETYACRTNDIPMSQTKHTVNIIFAKHQG